MKENWQNCTIGDVTEITDYVANGSFASLRENVSYKDEKDYAILVRLADYSNGFDENKFIYIDKHSYDFLAKSKLEGGEIIMSNVGSIGKLFLCPDLGMPMSLAPNSIVIKTSYNKFYYYLLSSAHYQNLIMSISSSTALPKFNKTSFKKLPILIPPLSEQERIVKELDLLSGIIEKQKQQLNELDTLAQSIFYSMFGDPITNEKNWEIKKLGEIGEFQRGGGFLKSDFVETGFPCIHYGQIHTKFNSIVYKNFSFISDTTAKKSKIAHYGDVIIAITSEDIEGSCKCIAWLGNYDIAIGAHSAIFSHKQNPIFIAFYFKTNAFNIEKSVFARGFKVVEIKPIDIAKINIYLPPIDLQNQFAEKIEKIEKQKETINKSIEETQKLFDYTMDKYFG